MIDYEQNPAYLEFANEILEAKYAPDPSRTVWLTKLNPDKSVSAVVIFTNFTGNNCEMMIASDGKSKWSSRKFIGTCYRYAFNQMKLSRISVIVEADNPRSIKVCLKLGHTIEGVLKCWHGMKDAVLMRMLPNECKWLEI